MAPLFQLFSGLLTIASVHAWDVAKTPPMGFNTWNLYHCAVDADILTQTAQAMVSTGLKDVGYIYVNSDDCWMSFNRSANGSQVPDPTKFPNGFKAVADFIHGVGMKSGLYTAKGPNTCQKRAASCLHEELDAKNWASWGIDYVKDDSCSICRHPNGTQYTDMEDYGRMWQAIQDSGRPMVLTVEGSPPAASITHGGYGNAKRVGHDISASWGSMISLVDIGAGLWPFAHTTINATFGGWWNDLDMIEIGNGGGTFTETFGATMYPWAIDPSSAGAGWTMANGAVKNGGLCMQSGNPVSLTTCDGSSSQQFTLESNGNLHPTNEKDSCVALAAGAGPRCIMFECKTGAKDNNEMFTLVDGQLCSKDLRNGKPLCLKPESKKPPTAGGGGGGGGGGFDCKADPAALARCHVHFTMWTIMKAPLLLGNDIRSMDQVALAVVKNLDALNVSQDELGVQARRVSVTSKVTTATHSMSAVVARCEASRLTQEWVDNAGVLTTTDAAGVDWCVHDVEATEEVGSWRAIPCGRNTASKAAIIKQRLTQTSEKTESVLTTPAGSYLTWNNAMGASGPVPHTRYLTTVDEPSVESTWHHSPVVGGSIKNSFKLKTNDKVAVLDDDKMGGVAAGGEFCLDVVADSDTEVWAGPLSGKRWAVALLNRDPNATATITVDYTMFNASATSTFQFRDVWKGQDVGSHTGSYSATVAPQDVNYLILTPA